MPSPVTKKTPTPRSTDTTLGKIVGYLSELNFYLTWDGYSRLARSIFGGIVLIGEAIVGAIEAICQAVYNWGYQSAYNQGADKGNQMNNQIMGWLNELKSQAFKYVDDTKAYLQTNLINPIKSQIDNSITPALNDAKSKISTLNTQVSNFSSQLTTMGNRLNSMDSSITDFQNKLNSFNSTLTDLNTKASNLDASLKDAQNKLSQYKSLIDDLDKRVKTLEQKQGLPFEGITLPPIFKS